MNLTEFARHLDKRKSLIEKKLSKASILLAGILIDELVAVTPQGTPVDTSKALSNWQITLDTPNAHEVDAHYPGSKKSTYSASAEATRQAATASLRAKKPGQVIFVSNPAPYIRELNYLGTSKQSPAHFVEEAVKHTRLMAPLIYRGIRNVR